MVTAVPAFSPAPSFNYVHVGWELKLYNGGRENAGKEPPRTIKLSQSRSHYQNTLSHWKATLKLFVFKLGLDRQKVAHSLREYFHRLAVNKQEIQGLAENLPDLCASGHSG